MQYDYQIIEEKFQSLPEEMQYAMTSPSVADKIRSIANKYGLLLDQMESLFDITSYVMLGLLPSNKFTSTLAKELNISEKQAQLIISDINTEIFSEVKNSMREFEELSKTKSVEDTDNPKTSDVENQLPVSTNSPTSTPQTNISDGEDIQSSTPLDTDSEIVSKPTHITDLEKAGGFTIEHENSSLSNSMIIDGVGSDVLRAGPVRDRWAPVQQTVVPKEASVTPIQAPKTNSPITNPVESISEKIQPISEPIAPTPPIPNNVAEISETEMPKAKEPLADQLLSMLDKSKEEKTFETKKMTPVPSDNLPTEEIKTVASTPAPTMPPPIPQTPAKPYTPPTPVSSPIPVNPVKVTTTPAPQPPKARGFDPYREPIQ